VKGATAYTGSGASLQIGFNPRAREGRDRKRLRELLMSKLSFNPRAREGRDQARAIHSLPLSSFNPRAREGRDLVKA